ncbi:MAG: PKD domain-containing protein [Methanomassiliicoccus sp.]|nr:PKD domain-containing protein [Methanomassiliicoccus sp.]
MGADNRTLPEDVQKKRPSTKAIAILLSVVLMIAAIAGAILLMGSGESKTAAEVVADRTAAAVGDPITFNASTSTSTGKITNYQWNFGDGTIENTTSSTNAHFYDVPGLYMVFLTVKDNKGKSATNWASPLAITIIESSVNPNANTANSTSPQAFMAVSDKLINTSTSVHFDTSSSRAWSTGLSGSTWASLLSNKYIKTMTLDHGDGSAPVSIDVAALLAANQTAFADHFVDATSNLTHVYAGDGAVYVAKLSVISVHDSMGGYCITIGVLPSNYNSEEVVKNPSTFIVATVSDPRTLDPARVSETNGGEIIQNCYETLVWYNGSSVSDLRPMLATVVPTVENGGISSDGLNYTFHIRSGVMFHSGNVMKPSDVEFSIERVLTMNYVGGPAWMLGQVMIKDYNASALDPELVDASIESDNSAMTVTFHLVNAFPAFIYILAFMVGSVVEEAYVQEHTPGGDKYNTINTWMDRNIDGTGPYTLGEWVSKEYIQMDRFDDYWQGPAELSHIIIMNVVQESTREMLLLAGDADNVYVGRQYLDGIRSHGDILSISEGEAMFNLDFIIMNQDISPGLPGGIGNISQDFFTDVHIRQAFAHAFNYSKYLQDVLHDTAIQPNGPIPQGMFGYDPSVPLYGYDLTEASQHLSLAQNPDQLGQSYLETGFQVKLFYPQGNDEWKAGSLLLKQGMESISTSITVEVVELGWNAYWTAAAMGQLPIYFCAWQPDYADPNCQVDPLLSSTGALSGYTGMENATLDSMILEALVELNETDRASLYSNISLACYDNAYMIWVKQATQFHVERSWVTGYYFNPMYCGLYYHALGKG